MSAGFSQAAEESRPVEEVRLRGSGLVLEGGWNPENFAREQIRGLVRQVFFSNVARPVRQVVFSGVEAATDVRSICLRVGVALALETVGGAAVVGAYPQVVDHTQMHKTATVQGSEGGTSPLRQSATRIPGNLWLVPALRKNGDRVSAASLHSYMGDIRREFEYSIVEGPPVGESNEAAAMAQFADGIILVLAAQRTRRMVARKIKETLESGQVRILGAVLSDRAFPIPEGIYRRL